MNRKDAGYLMAVEGLLQHRFSDDEAASILLEYGYSVDMESAKRSVKLIHNDISNFRMAKP